MRKKDELKAEEALSWAMYAAVAELILVTLLSVFSFASLFLLAERHAGSRLDFHDAIYFSVITLLTIGYGDIVPTSSAARVLVLACVVALLVALPIMSLRVAHTRDSLTALEGTSAAKSRPAKKLRHLLVVLGDETFVTERTTTLLRALTSVPYTAMCDAVTVVAPPFLPSVVRNTLKRRVRMAQCGLHTEVVFSSLFEDDARAVFSQRTVVAAAVLAPNDSTTQTTLLQALSLKFRSPLLPVSVLLPSRSVPVVGETRAHTVDDVDDATYHSGLDDTDSSASYLWKRTLLRFPSVRVIAPADTMAQITAAAFRLPSLNALLSTLLHVPPVTTVNVKDTAFASARNDNSGTGTFGSEDRRGTRWLQEVCDGMQYGIHLVTVSPVLAGLTFAQVSAMARHFFRITVLGTLRRQAACRPGFSSASSLSFDQRFPPLRPDTEVNEVTVCVNPMSRGVVHEGETVFVVARDLTHAMQLSTFVGDNEEAPAFAQVSACLSAMPEQAVQCLRFLNVSYRPPPRGRIRHRSDCSDETNERSSENNTEQSHKQHDSKEHNKENKKENNSKDKNKKEKKRKNKNE
ncbi:MAG: hypothetical protein MHM6MM_007289, partial [Cercozoa sp. M6MM]